MKCLDQNGVKYLWNCIFNNAVSKSDVDLSTNVNSLNPISNNAVCNYVGSIAESLRNSKADYEIGTCTLEWAKVSPTDYATSLCANITRSCSYKRIGNICYLSMSHGMSLWKNSNGTVNTDKGYLGFVSGLPFTPKEATNNIGRLGIGNTALGKNYFTVWLRQTALFAETPIEMPNSEAYLDMTVMYEIA